MAALPPYSTFRTDNKQLMYPQATAHGNILAFAPPGFNQIIQVKFPDKRLAVCAKCKKNYKTREMCRERNGHTAEPWGVHYVCITIDDSCLDEQGNYIDKPLTARMVQWQPFVVTEQFGKEPDGKLTPVCAGCKKTNRTRAFCRTKHKHRHLPWCTVFVMLSAVDKTDPTTIVAGPSIPIDCKLDYEEAKSSDAEVARAAKARVEQREAAKKIKVADDCDDINEIPESRTFVCMISHEIMSMKWVELSDFDASAGGRQQGVTATAPPVPRTANGVNAHDYFQQLAAMGYTPQQQQHAWQVYLASSQAQAAGQAAAMAGPPPHYTPVHPHHPPPMMYPPHAMAAWAQHPHPGAAAYPGLARLAPAPTEGARSPSSAQQSSTTADEAAAANQKEGRRGNQRQQETDHLPSQHATDQEQQYHAQMMYQQQMYQQHLQMQHEQGLQGVHMDPNPIGETPQEPTAEDFAGLDDEYQQDSKRQRLEPSAESEAV